MKMQWRLTGNWTLVGMIRPDHEVYAVFDPLTTKAQATAILKHSVPLLLQSPALWATA